MLPDSESDDRIVERPRKPALNEQYALSHPSHQKIDDALANFLNRKGKFVAENPTTPEAEAVMAEVPSREEIAAHLAAAEARTETRIAELRAAIDARGMAADHKIDTLSNKMDNIADIVRNAAKNSADAVASIKQDTADAVSSMKADNAKALEATKADNKDTRKTFWIVATASVIAILGTVIALWTSSLTIQANVISAFQAGIAAHSSDGAVGSPASPSAGALQPSAPPRR